MSDTRFGAKPSANCECGYVEPYGFVPEADCPEHDTPLFFEFLRVTVERAGISAFGAAPVGPEGASNG
jgi:hypothetical protein